MKLMHLFEREEDEIPFHGEDPEDEYGRSDPSQDQYLQRGPEKTGNPKFTLRRINRLKKIRATKDLEQLKREELLSAMYGQSSGEEEGGMGL